MINYLCNKKTWIILKNDTEQWEGNISSECQLTQYDKDRKHESDDWKQFQDRIS